jgi:hypothetical protein
MAASGNKSKPPVTVTTTRTEQQAIEQAKKKS